MPVSLPIRSEVAQAAAIHDQRRNPKAIEFIIKTEAQSSAKIDSLAEAQKRAEENWARADERWARTDESIRALLIGAVNRRKSHS